jgi:hypothetical protein
MLGDGIRRNLATVSKEERDLFIDAIKQLNHIYYSPAGSRTDFPAGHVSYWFKQDEIHQSSHVHGCPAFLPWHREMLNRFEALLRTVHPQLSLHYWDWSLDPSHMPDGEGGFINLFDSEFMGNADGTVNEGSPGEPLLSAGFYIQNPSDAPPADGKYRDDFSPVVINRPNPADPSTFSYPNPAVAPHIHYNPADPPRTLTRDKTAGAPPVGVSGSGWASDTDFMNAHTWEDFRDLMYGDEQGTSGVGAHGSAHGYIGGSLGDPHLSFRDPFVFLMHSNIDRLWAAWQRQPGHSDRLDPATAYGSEGSSTGSGDVDAGDPQWGILSPMEPWSGYSAQTAATGIITSLLPIRPWFAPENEQTLPGNYKTGRDITIVIPPSYDTAPHSSYIVANQDIFSSSQAAVSPTFAQAIYVIYEGFQPREVGGGGAPLPALTFAIGGGAVGSITAINPQVLFESPAGAPDMPQRITIAYDVHFADLSVFPGTPGAQTPVVMQANLHYTVGGTAVAAADQSVANLLLVAQPSPFMMDIEPTTPPPGPPNPSWLSADTRVFQIVADGLHNIAGVTQPDPASDANAPFTFIKGLVNHFNSLPDDSAHPFLTELTAGEAASQLELSPIVGGKSVFNFAVAKIRYRGNVPASNVSAFFRAFKTMVSALDYDQTGGSSVTGNYRRSGNTPGSVPLLGLQSNEIASIPFFAAPRVDTGSQSMTAQTDDAINSSISFAGTGDEVMYCGVWLDINDTAHQRFPINPAADPGGVNGPYHNPRLTIQQLVTGLHYCLVTEIFFWPAGTTSDPIPANSTPASSDRLAQRNLAFESSGNPGWPSTHTVQHTFLVKPSQVFKPGGANRGSDKASSQRIVTGPDELMIEWGNVPRASKATFYFPEVTADEILGLAALRQRPVPIAKVDAHTISVSVADVSFIPLPSRPSGNLAGLVTLTLPQGVRVGQSFKFSVQQYSGVALSRRAHKVLGAFQFNIPVQHDPDILPVAFRNLSILRYVHQSIPAGSRWHPIFVRWLDGLAKKVAGLGGDPAKALPSPNGNDRPPDHKHEPCEVRACDLLRMNIPWDECDVEGEVDIKVRFKKKGK